MNYRQGAVPPPPVQAHPPLYSHSAHSHPYPHPSYPHPHPYLHPSSYPYPYAQPSYWQPSHGQQHSNANVGRGPPPVIPPPSAPLQSHQTPRAPVDSPHPAGYGIKLTGPPPPSTYLWNPRGPEYQTNPVSMPAPNQTHNTSYLNSNIESHGPRPPMPTPNPNPSAHIPPPIQSGHSSLEGRNVLGTQDTTTTGTERPPKLSSTQNFQGRFDFPPRRGPPAAADSARASESRMPSSARDDDSDARTSRRQSWSSVVENTTVDRSASHQKSQADLSAVRDEPSFPRRYEIEVDKRVPPDTRSPNVRPLKSILRKPGVPRVDPPSCCRASNYQGKGKAKEQKTEETSASTLPWPSDSKGKETEREYRTENATGSYSHQRSDSKGKGKEGDHVVGSGDGPSNRKTSSAFASNSGHKETSDMTVSRPPTPGIIMRDPNFKDKLAPAQGQRQHSHRSLPPQSDKIQSEGKIRLNPLLLNVMPTVPALDWDITLPVPLAKKWTPQRYCVPLSRADLHQTAVDPPVNELYIFKDNQKSPVFFAFSQWGPIRVQARHQSEDGSVILPFVTIGDVLQGIHRYFSTRLTTSDMQKLESEAVAWVFGSRAERSVAASRTDPERANVIVSTEPLRGDELYGYLNYGGLEMSPDFSNSKTLYLKVQNPNRRR